MVPQNKFLLKPSSAPRAGIVSERKKPSVWLYLDRCAIARNFPVYRGGESHHDPAYQKSPATGRRHIQGRSLEIRFGVTPVYHGGT